MSDTLKSKAAYRNIPLPPVLASYLEEIERKSDFVMCNAKGDKYSATTFRNMWGIVKRRQISKDEEIGSFDMAAVSWTLFIGMSKIPLLFLCFQILSCGAYSQI